MMNKRGIAWSFLVMLIIGVILFVLVTSWVSSLFRLSDQGIESFNNLADTVKAIAKNTGSESLETIVLRLDRGTALAVFPKDTAQLILHTPGVLRIQMDRPVRCEPGKPCICLCREPGWDNTNPVLYKLPCEKETCHSFEQPANGAFDFKREQRYEKSYWEGGLFILRQNKAAFSHALNTYFDTDLPRMNEVSVHRLGNEVDIFLVS